MFRIKKAGYDAIDFDLYDYYEHIMHPSWATWAKEVHTATFAAGLTITQTHAQIGFAADADLQYKPPTEVFFRNIQVCAILGCKNIVFHPIVSTATISTDENRKKLMDYNVRWFNELAKLAKEVGVRNCLESSEI